MQPSLRAGQAARRPNLRRRVSAALAHPAATRSIPFAIFIAFMMLSSLIAAIAPQEAAGDLRWLSVLRAAVVAAALACFWRHYAELGAIGEVRPRHWLLAAGFGLAVFVIWIHFSTGWAVLGPSRSFDPTAANGEIDVVLASMRLAELSLVVPVMEELFWRSFLLRWLDTRNFTASDPRRASPRAMVLTTVLFASEHSLWFAGLIAGMVFNWIYIRTGNLWVPIAAHAITNAALGIWILATRSWHLW